MAIDERRDSAALEPSSPQPGRVRAVLSRLRPSRAVVIILACYLVARAFSFLVLYLAYKGSLDWPPALWDGARTFAGYLQSWDGPYYRTIAEHGYPTTLPRDAAGNIAKNPWAFLPLFPMIVKAVMAVFHTGFLASGLAISLVFGAGATLALRWIIASQLGPKHAFWGAIFFAFGPMTWIFNVPYAEGVFLCFTFISLGAVFRRRWALASVAGVLAAFAHPGALAIPATIGILALFGIRRREKPAFGAVMTAIIVGVAGFAWPFVASFVTGNPSAYFQTELSWWADYLGRITFVPFTPWFLFTNHLWGGLGILYVSLILAFVLWWILWGSSRRLGVPIRAFTFSHMAYLVAVFLPQQSIFRMLLPLYPLIGHPALSSSRPRQIITLAINILLVPLCIVLFWVIYPP